MFFLKESKMKINEVTYEHWRKTQNSTPTIPSNQEAVADLILVSRQTISNWEMKNLTQTLSI